MARTTTVLVKDVMRPGRHYDGTSDLTPFIRIANLVTTRVGACASANDNALTADELTEIETWLAAHYYCASDRPAQEKDSYRASARFQGKTDMGLQSTYYGQAALDLDPSGCLVQITAGGAGRKRARLVWLGRPRSEQTDYQDRN